MPTKIEWCDETLNVVTGCTKISPGCKNCYAENIIKRFGRGDHLAHGSSPDRRFENVTIHPERTAKPYDWRKPRSIFLCSMGDLFHNDVPYDFIYNMMNTIINNKRHTFLVLTKRPENIIKHLSGRLLPENMWVGVSVEDQIAADNRIPMLLNSGAQKRFVSVEPILEKIDLTTWLGISEGFPGKFARDTGSDLDWVIAGCESGPKRRPAKIDWFRSLRDQCITAKVPFFLKQAPGYNNGKTVVVKMPVLDNKVWDQKP